MTYIILSIAVLANAIVTYRLVGIINRLRRRVADLQDWRAQTIEQRVQLLEAALDSSHQQFKSGTVCAAAGATLALVGALLPVKGGEWDYWKITSVSFGSALLTLGTVLYIDSHKYMGRMRPIPGGVALRIGKP